MALPFFMLWKVNALCLPGTALEGDHARLSASLRNIPGILQLAVCCVLALCKTIFCLLYQFSK